MFKEQLSAIARIRSLFLNMNYLRVFEQFVSYEHMIMSGSKLRQRRNIS